MKNDRKNAVVWSELHWQIARYVCVFIAILGYVLTYFDVLSARGAMLAIAVGVVYVLVLTKVYTTDNRKKREGAT